MLLSLRWISRLPVTVLMAIRMTDVGVEIFSLILKTQNHLSNIQKNIVLKTNQNKVINSNKH